MAWFMSRRCGVGWDVPPQDTRNGDRKKKTLLLKRCKKLPKRKGVSFPSILQFTFSFRRLKNYVLSFFSTTWSYPPLPIPYKNYLKINSWKMKKLLFGPLFSGPFCSFFQGSRDPAMMGKPTNGREIFPKKPRIWAILSQAQAMQRDPPQTQHFQPLAGIVVDFFFKEPDFSWLFFFPGKIFPRKIPSKMVGPLFSCSIAIMIRIMFFLRICWREMVTLYLRKGWMRCLRLLQSRKSPSILLTLDGQHTV